MKLRWILAGLLGLAALAGAWMAYYTWTEPDGGRWIFVAFAAMLAVLAWAIGFPAKPREATGTRFAPSWYMEGAVLVLVILILLVVASCVFGRR